jgi:hypothetical protein
MATRGPTNPLSDQHKAAIAVGRVEARAVREYLVALRSAKLKRGRKRSPDSIKQRIAAIEAEPTATDPLVELRLIQERRNLSNELESMGSGVDMDALEAEFIKAAKSYSERRGIAYATWRDVGVEASVLKAAGIGRDA